MPNLPIDMLPREVRSAVKQAEREDGYRYGAGVYDDAESGRPCFVSIQFHPKRAWFLTIGAQPPRRLTPELYARVERLKLRLDFQHCHATWSPTLTIMKGARIGEYTDKTICCDHCGRCEHFGPIALKQVSYLAWREGWVRLTNDGDSWNLYPDCSIVPTVSTFSQQQENHL